MKLGKNGPAVSTLGLGCMGMSGMYGPTQDDEGIATIHAAIDRGVTLLDTGDFYGIGHNEMLIGKAIAGRRDKVVLSVKFGVMRSPDGAFNGMDTRPVAVKNFCAYSLKRLGVEVIDVYRPSRVDPNVPIEDTVGAVADLIKAGYVRHLGLSEVGVETIKRAHAVHPVADLQIEYSIASRGPEAKIFPALKELGIGATLYGVFSRGLLTGSKKPEDKTDFRAHLPRFNADNEKAVQAVSAFAKEQRLTPAQLLLGWVMTKEPGFVPLVGVKTVAQLTDALGTRPLAPEVAAALEKIVPPVTGDRYPEPLMKHLDSER
jgi:aryl-alcohol dehydrogenase-like predicted oxidoreductase